MRNPILLAVVGLTLAASTTSAGEFDQPIPQNPEKARKARLDALAWTERTLAVPYEKVGKKDPRWDALVRELMKTAVPLFVRPEDSSTHDDVYKAAKKAIDAGCDDPIVLYIYARSSTGRS